MLISQGAPPTLSPGRKRRTIGSTLRRIAIVLSLSVLMLVGLYRFIPPPFTPLMLIRAIESTIQGKGFQWRRQWRPIERISIHLVRAVIAAEDQKFSGHAGFDLEAIQKAWANNSRGKARHGGSTISQQTAKNVFLWPGPSYLRKGIEVGFTALIEGIWGKKRILEVYLNVAEFGPNIYGVEQACQTYFPTSAQRLTKSQAAVLAAILPAPRRWNPAKPSPYLNQRRQWILRQMDAVIVPDLR